MLLAAKLSARYGKGPDVLRGLELEMEPGEVVGLVGESGSGKSTVAMAISRLLEFRGGSARGEVWFQGRDLMALRQGEMRAIRGKEMALVPQSPLAALNPAMNLRDQILECRRAHGGPGVDLMALLEMVNLPCETAFLDRYPRQLSVGQAQRVLIAMAILHRPSLLIADEPTSALDAVTQAEILKLLSGLSRQLGMSILYISHDLLSVAALCNRIAILREGEIVESNAPERLFADPQHPYTRTLLGAIPTLPFLHSAV
jgi:ABC-type glutathione transport system ATPase component